ncbi:MAG: hypothetical protein PHT44_00510 [Candidatus Portnoybacteria bacterium]|nr:hypothetical protein [Candidatus Portnoybacteria bacterium]MDD4982904.1 hypothetical protein [Candidatus Portnoybacteria bacterium]
MKKSTKKILKGDQRGAATILLSFFVMSILLMIALAAASIMIYQIRMSREASQSVPAFYAADAAAEKCLYQLRKLPPNSGDDCTKNNKTIQINLNNGAVGFAEVKGANTLQAWGIFGSTRRNLELTW